jgi:predicted nucleic acid-binding protein
MAIFLDTNVLLDVLLERHPHYLASASLWTLCEQRRVEGQVAVISFNNAHCILRKLKGRGAAERGVELLRDIFVPIALDLQVLNQAIGARMNDFEDAIQYYSAVRGGAECIVTRNVGHFPKDGVRVMTPGEYLVARGV